MELACKPDLDDCLRRWDALWNHDLIKRPAAVVYAPRSGMLRPAAPMGQVRPDTDFERLLDQAEAYMAATYYAGEALPFFLPSFGPDQLAAFVGATLNYSDKSDYTSWSVPFVKSWRDALPLRLGAASDTWQRMIEFCRLAGRRGQGKYLVGMIDLHSNLDWLAAIRDPVNMGMDLLCEPQLVHEAFRSVRGLYRDVYSALYEAAGMAQRGTIGWLPYYCRGRFATTQCDFACLLSPEQFNEFALPALREECDFLDHAAYHYDGASALQHFDAVTAIESLDAIQWVPTAGSKPFIEWIDLLKRFQQRGKNVIVYCTPAEVPFYHRELKPNLVLYEIQAKSEAEADETLAWLERHT